jgi:hypothetical protein
VLAFYGRDSQGFGTLNDRVLPREEQLTTCKKRTWLGHISVVGEWFRAARGRH